MLLSCENWCSCWTNRFAFCIIGLLCCFVTVLFFAAPLTMLLHVIKIKNVESLPFPLILSNFFVSLEWFVYGCLISDAFLQVISVHSKETKFVWEFLKHEVLPCSFVLHYSIRFQITNFLGCVLSGAQLLLFVIYPSRINYGGPVYKPLDQTIIFWNHIDNIMH